MTEQFFVKSKQEIKVALNIIEIFGSLSGLKLNRDKTVGIWLGNLKHVKSSRDKYEKYKLVNKANKILRSILWT